MTTHHTVESSQHRWRMCGAQLKMLAPTHLPHRCPSKRRSLEALWGAVTNRHKRRKKNSRWSVGLKSVACCQISALSCKVAKFQWTSLLFCSISSAVAKNFAKISESQLWGITELVFGMSESFWSLQWRRVRLKNIDALRQQPIDDTASMGLSVRWSFHPRLRIHGSSNDHPGVLGA